MGFFWHCFGLIPLKTITVLLVSIGHTVCNGVSVRAETKARGKGRLAAMPFAVKPPILKPKTPGYKNHFKEGIKQASPS